MFLCKFCLQFYNEENFATLKKIIPILVFPCKVCLQFYNEKKICKVESAIEWKMNFIKHSPLEIFATNTRLVSWNKSPTYRICDAFRIFTLETIFSFHFYSLHLSADDSSQQKLIHEGFETCELSERLRELRMEIKLEKNAARE